MKKTIVELYFLDKHNGTYVSAQTPRFVCWHCSSLPPYKFDRLMEKIKVSLPRIFVAGLSYVLLDFFGSAKFKIISKINDGEPQLWSSTLVKETFRKMLQHARKSRSKKSVSVLSLGQFPFRIEIKIIKYRVVFGLHYPEGFHSAIISNKILQSLDKYFRNLFKALKI